MSRQDHTAANSGARKMYEYPDEHEQWIDTGLHEACVPGGCKCTCHRPGLTTVMHIVACCNGVTTVSLPEPTPPRPGGRFEPAPVAPITPEERAAWSDDVNTLMGNPETPWDTREHQRRIRLLLTALDASEQQLRSLKHTLWERDVDHHHEIVELKFTAEQFETMRREKEHGWREAERHEQRADKAEGELRAVIARVEALAGELPRYFAGKIRAALRGDS